MSCCVRIPTDTRSTKRQNHSPLRGREYGVVRTLEKTRRSFGAFVFTRISPKVFYLSRTALRHAEDARRVGSGLRPSDLQMRNVWSGGDARGSAD